jgi:hypothetical protein
VATTLLPKSTKPASGLSEHVPPGGWKPPSGTPGEGSEQADAPKHPTADQSKNLNDFTLDIRTPASFERASVRPKKVSTKPAAR